MLQKSPSGSLCPYHYKGAVLQPLHYGSYHHNMAALAEVINAEEAFILAPTSPKGRLVWIDLYENDFTAFIIDKLAQHIANISPKVSKMALVGCPKRVFKNINRQLADKQCPLAGKIKLFEDPELAKDWLAGKGG